MPTIEQRIVKVIAATLQVPESKLLPNARLVRDLGADSLDMVELAIELENEFGIAIADEQIEQFDTLQKIIDYTKKAVVLQGELIAIT